MGARVRVERPPVLSYLPPGQDPFAPGERAPDALAYFRAYCAIAALLCGAGAVLLVATAAKGFNPASPKPDDWVALVVCVVASIASLAFGAAFVIGAVSPRRPWMHTYGLVLLIAGLLTQSCCFPLVVLLLVQWTKPEVKAWFRDAAPPPPPPQPPPQSPPQQPPSPPLA